MHIFPPAFPVHTEHHRAIRREVIKDFACSALCFIKELTVENKPGHTPRLLSLHAVIDPRFFTQLFERMEDTHPGKSSASTRFFITEDGQFATLSLCGEYALEILWKHKTPSPSDLSFAIDAITVFGIPPRDPYDLTCDLLSETAQNFGIDAPNAVHAKFSADHATFTINPVAWIFNALDCARIDCTHGQISLLMHHSAIRLKFERNFCATPKVDIHEIKISTFLPECATEQPLALPGLRLSPQPSDCPDIEHIHHAASRHDTLSKDEIQKAIQEARNLRPSYEMPTLLYYIYKWAPDSADLVRMNLLTNTDQTGFYPVAFDILKDIYLRQDDDEMLLALIQQRAHECSHAPHMRIRLQIEAANILTQSFQRFDSAVKKLETIKPLIQTIATPEEKIDFANAYSQAQYHNTAIQYLRLWINQTDSPAQIVKFGECLARILLDHNEPLQSIINICRKILDIEPQNLEILSILAQSLENSDNFEEAIDAYLACFELLVSIWEQAKTLAELSPSAINAQALAISRQNAIKAAQSIENVIEKVPDYPGYNRVLELHLKLVPNDMHILTKRLNFLSPKQAFPEMAKACLDFLHANQNNLSPDDAITLHLMLHNLYECEFDQPEEAQKHLDAATNISEFDPRVLITQIERCQRRNLPKEQVRFMTTLIDVLPPAEAAEQTLELVKHLESLNTPSEKILDILRKTNTRSPNHPQILLELRQYLRKCGQFFELAIILEKLARTTKDLQAKKNLLLEASETNDKLGNTQRAQALYHEAQLCSPINPDKFDFVPNDIVPGFASPSKSKLEPVSSLTSILLSSRSVSIADIPIISDDSESQYYTQMPSSEVSISAELISSTSAAIVTTAFPEDETETTSACADSDEHSPLQVQIMHDRMRGDTESLLNHLLQSIQDIPESEIPPRVLQEIGCIYLYDQHAPQTARQFLERASKLSPEVANGEQTLNALEAVYLSLKCYRDLSDIYQKKCRILTMSDERRRYEIRLAQLRYEHLGETELAIETLDQIIKKTPDNEAALQLLAQIYIDIKDYDNAIRILNEITKYRVPGSKQMAQHLIRLIKLYIETGDIETAKNKINRFIDSNEFSDKLAVIEIYKHICRERDEWTELLDILKTEIACLMKIPPVEIHEHLEQHLNDANISTASNALREYADILYHKCNKISEAVTIYRALIHILPEHQYPQNMLKEIYTQHPEFNTSDSDS
ncbi:MAG: tetratricopeptide repeat protein [Proteobacteria bacterium]|nr:tetratricopeptide repeat protein [Pseudomonadota bacterium]